MLREQRINWRVEYAVHIDYQALTHGHMTVISAAASGVPTVLPKLLRAAERPTWCEFALLLGNRFCRRRATSLRLR